MGRNTKGLYDPSHEHDSCGVGFIGIGLQPPTASLGVLISDGYHFIHTNVWLVVFPTATIAVLMLCFTFLGDGLRDALDPRTR